MMHKMQARDGLSTSCLSDFLTKTVEVEMIWQIENEIIWQESEILNDLIESENYMTEKVKSDKKVTVNKNDLKVKIWPGKWKWKLCDKESESGNDLTKK